jgi:hypothetical protein
VIRRSPAEYYLKYLLVHPDDFSDEQIREIVMGKQLDFIGMSYLDRLRPTCVPPIPFYPEDEYHFPSQRFLIKHKIVEMFQPNEDLFRANELLENPRAKETIESSIMSGAGAAWVSALLRRQGIQCNVETIEHYCHYYWNIELVDFTELSATLRLRSVLVEPTDDPHEQAQPMALHHAMYRDRRKLAAEMPLAPLAMLMQEVRSGYMPSHVELSKILHLARTAATACTLKELMFDTRPERARDYAITAKMMHEMIEVVGDPESDLHESLRTLALKTQSGPVPQIHQLTEGRHTVDLQPTEEPEEIDAGESSRTS